MEEPKSDYHNANSFPLNDLDQTTSTTYLSPEKKTENTFKTSGTTLLEGTDKNNQIRNKSYSSFGNPKESIGRSTTTKGTNTKHQAQHL